jgi:predicted O-methyltransferase YrrM
MNFEEEVRSLVTKFEAGQNYQEIAWFMEACKKVNPKIVVEIGVYNCGNIRLLSTLVSDPDGLVVGIDFDWSHLGATSTAPGKLRLNKAVCPVIFMDGNSQEVETSEKLRGVLNGRKIDVLFIDGDHGSNPTRIDYELFSPMVKDGGIIGVHDLNDGGTKEQNAIGEFNTKGFWDKLDHPRKFEYHADKGFGIGYLIK